MSRSLDQSRPFRAGRHRAEPAPVITAPLPPTSSGAEAPNPGPAPTEPASAGLRRRRDRRPAFEIPPAPESAPAAEAASPATEAIPAVAPRNFVPDSALRAAPAATRRTTARRGAAEQPAEATPVTAPSSSGPATAHSPQVATAFSSDAQAVLGRAASVRVMGHRMAVVAGALGVLLAVGAAGQATELPFFGKESSAQDARSTTDATRSTLGTQPTYANGRATPRPSTSTPPGTPGAAPGTEHVPAAADPEANAVPAVADLPMPVDAPTLAGILAATPAAVAPSSGPSVELQPPVISSVPPAAPASPAAAAPAPSPTATAPAPSPVAASPAPSPTPTTSPAAGDGTSDEAVDTRAYASTRLASYGWGAEQMDALIVLWDTSIEWRPSQVDRGLRYIKERYGSPAKALEFRAANNWF